MTTPFPAPSYEQPPPEEGGPATEAALAALVVFLASSAAVTAVVLPPTLVAALVAVGVAPKAARAAGRIALGVPMTGRSRFGAPGLPGGLVPSAARRAAANEPPLRARYVLAASRRLTEALVEGRFLDALRTEQRHLRAHVAAGRNRHHAARRLDETARRDGPWLVWRTQRDDRVSPDCWAREGMVFTLDDPPWPPPGAQHPACRCYATGATLGELMPRVA